MSSTYTQAERHEIYKKAKELYLTGRYVVMNIAIAEAAPKPIKLAMSREFPELKQCQKVEWYDHSEKGRQTNLKNFDLIIEQTKT